MSALMHNLQLVVTIFLVANITVGDYEPLKIVMIQPAAMGILFSYLVLSLSTQHCQPAVSCSATAGWSGGC